MDSNYKFSFYYYEKNFKIPLVTNHGVWEKREGIIISLEDDNSNQVKSEIAPISWFGTESLLDALNFCQQIKQTITVNLINNISDELPCCQFAFQSAFNELKLIQNKPKYQDQFNTINEHKNFNYSYLLPTGKQAINYLEKNYNNLINQHTFKWKIGINCYQEERELLKELITLLPPKSRLRLDANGGLNNETLTQWLKMTEELNIIEFIEQPLPPTQLDLMIYLAKNYVTPLALDESVANLKQLIFCYEKGWRGVFVIKPLIFGYGDRLVQYVMQYQLDVVLSSVFETEIGRKMALKLANLIQNPHRAIGFGVNQWFTEGITDNFGNNPIEPI